MATPLATLARMALDNRMAALAAAEEALVRRKAILNLEKRFKWQQFPLPLEPEQNVGVTLDAQGNPRICMNFNGTENVAKLQETLGVQFVDTEHGFLWGEVQATGSSPAIDIFAVQE